MHVSNVLGAVLDVEEVVQQARRVGARVMLDACQSLPHMPVDVQALGVDWLVASSHKMCGPTGVGFLWGRWAAAGQGGGAHCCGRPGAVLPGMCCACRAVLAAAERLAICSMSVWQVQRGATPIQHQHQHVCCQHWYTRSIFLTTRRQGLPRHHSPDSRAPCPPTGWKCWRAWSPGWVAGR